MIQLRGINKTYFNGAPLHVLKGIDLDIEKGEMVSIMGSLPILTGTEAKLSFMPYGPSR